VARHFNRPGYRFTGYSGGVDLSALGRGHHRLRLRVVLPDGRHEAISAIEVPIEVRRPRLNRPYANQASTRRATGAPLPVPVDPQPELPSTTVAEAVASFPNESVTTTTSSPGRA
jgi:hypothetical protein